VPDPSPAAAIQWPQYLSGGPERVRCILDSIIESSGADEIVLQDLIADHRTRLRSYELIADACGLAAGVYGLETGLWGLDSTQTDPRRAVAEKPTRSPR
jgi:hypothetical protein